MDDDGSTNSAASAPRVSDPATDEPPGLRAQIGATFRAGKRLLTAHVDLAKAEMADIAGAVGRMVGLFAVAFVLVLFAASLLAIGGLLFLGEWLFGSIGWGVLLGTVLLVDLALVAVLMALDVSGKRIGSSFLVAVVIGVVVGLVLGLDLTHRGWQLAANAVFAGTATDMQVILLAVGIVGGIGALLGLILGARAGSRDGVVVRALVGAVVGLLLGALLGLLGSIPIGAQVGAAIGVLVGLLAWPIVAGRSVASAGIDGDALKKKFTPETTIELTKETIEWVRARTPLGPKSEPRGLDSARSSFGWRQPGVPPSTSRRGSDASPRSCWARPGVPRSCSSAARSACSRASDGRSSARTRTCRSRCSRRRSRRRSRSSGRMASASAARWSVSSPTTSRRRPRSDGSAISAPWPSGSSVGRSSRW